MVGGEVVVILQQATKDESDEGEQLVQTGGPEGQGRREGRRHRCAVQADLNNPKVQVELEGGPRTTESGKQD